MFIQNFKLYEDVNKSKSLLKKLSISEKDTDYLKLRSLLETNPGYVYWFTKLMFVDKTPFQELVSLWDTIKNNRDIIQQFKKKIVEMDSIEEFYDVLDTTKNLMKAKRMYNELPSLQKRFINIDDPASQSILILLSEKEDRADFLKKISSYKTRESFINALNRFIHNRINGGFTSKLIAVKKTGAVVVYEDSDNDIIICRVDYPQICQLGGDTSWCIVRSAATFKSYTSSLLSQQFIIFLTDKSDNYSKIGLTTNLRGYHTAHLKDDTHFPQEKLSELFNERSVPMSIVLVDKNNIPFDMFNQVDVDYLLNVGYTKDVIFKHKKKYIGKDLNSLTKEEIEKHNLLKKIRVSTLSQLSAYSKEEIVKNKMLDLVDQLLLIDMVNFGFSYEDKNLPYERLWTELLSTEDNARSASYIKDEERKKIFSTKQGYKKLTFFTLIPSYKIALMRFFKFTKDDVDIKSISDMDIQLKTKVDFLLSIGFELSDNLFDGLATYKDGYNHYLNVYREYPSFSDYAVLRICKYVEKYPFNHIEANTFIQILSDKDYQKVYKANQDQLIGDSYRAKIRNDHRINRDSTVKNIKFFQLNKYYKLDETLELLDESSSSYSDPPEILRYLKELYPTATNDELYEALIENIPLERSDDNRIITFIQNNLNASELKDYLFNKYMNSKLFQSKYAISSIKKVLTDSQIDAINGVNRKNEVIDSIKLGSKYWSTSNRNLDKIDSPKIWWDRYGEEAIQIDYTKLKKGYDDSLDYTVGVIMLLLNNNKFEELSNLKFSMTDTGSFGKTTLKTLCKIICDKEITNWKPTWNIPINDEQKKQLYKLILSKVDESDIKTRITLQVVYYIYDKTKFNNLITDLLKLRKNYKQHYARKHGFKLVTNRVKEITPIIGYLIEEGYDDEVYELVVDFLTRAKMTKSEKSLGYDAVRGLNTFYVRDIKNPESNKRDLEQRARTSKDRISALFSDKTNESYVFRFNDFFL